MFHAKNPSTLSPVICYISPGSAKLTGGAPGLQIRCEAGKAVSGGFDSHALPPREGQNPETSLGVLSFLSLKAQPFPVSTSPKTYAGRRTPRPGS
jgi:hypothetical protein